MFKMQRSNLVLDLPPKMFFDLKNYRHAKLFTGCQYPWEALSNISDYLASITGNVKESQYPGVYFVNPESIYIDEECVIEAGAFIQGPCFIGRGTAVRHGAYIRGNVVTGEYCVIGHTTEVKGSILLDKAHAAHFNYVGDSILGNNTNLGAGAKIANLRLDGKEIYIQVEDERVGTGMRKLGVILGDGSQIGCNAVTNPGTIIGPHAKWYPCVNRGGYFPPNSVIK
jgi:NDP-sugar pyrophosphorylase family protein